MKLTGNVCAYLSRLCLNANVNTKCSLNTIFFFAILFVNTHTQTNKHTCLNIYMYIDIELMFKYKQIVYHVGYLLVLHRHEIIFWPVPNGNLSPQCPASTLCPMDCLIVDTLVF